MYWSFNKFGIEIDLSTPEKERAFHGLVLHYSYIVRKIQKHLRNGKKGVLAKFPDKTKPFYVLSLPHPIFVKSKDADADVEMEIDG